MSMLARDLGRASLKPPPPGRHPTPTPQYVLQGCHFLGVLRLDSLTSLEEQVALFGELWASDTILLLLGIQRSLP